MHALSSGPLSKQMDLELPQTQRGVFLGNRRVQGVGSFLAITKCAGAEIVFSVPNIISFLLVEKDPAVKKLG